MKTFLISLALTSLALMGQTPTATAQTTATATANEAAPDFTLNDINGKPLALSSLKGKTVVIDFWGSWCGWCIKGIPTMKEYYEKYKAKGLEILGVDCRESESQWKTAVKKYNLPWLHVRNSETNDVAKLYDVKGYPTKIVVDKNGNIAKVILGEDPAFYSYLDELFK